MNGIIQRKIEVQESYLPLVTEQTIASVTISCPGTNADVVYFHGDDDSDVPWVPGEWHDFKSVDLAGISVKGTFGDIVTIVGGAW